MNLPVILTLILVILGIITSLTGSGLFWGVIVLLPAIIIIRTRSRIEATYAFLIIFLFIFFGIALIQEGVVSVGDFIVLLYLCLFVFLLGILLGVKPQKGSSLSHFAFFGFILAIIGTILIGRIMPTPVTKNQSVSGSQVNTQKNLSSTGATSTGNTYPLTTK